MRAPVRHRVFSRTWSALALAALLALLAPLAGAQAVNEAEVKAGFVFNFIKFTQWPGAREGQLLRLCTVSQQPLQGHLLRLQGRSVGSRVIEVRTAVQPGDWRQCDALFLGEEDADRLSLLAQRLAGAPVLTLGDLPGFVEAGGMIGLRVEAARVRFDVQLGSAQNAGLVLNSQMLKLAGKVVQ